MFALMFKRIDVFFKKIVFLHTKIKRRVFRHVLFRAIAENIIVINSSKPLAHAISGVMGSNPVQVRKRFITAMFFLVLI